MPDAHPAPVMCGIVIHASVPFHLQTSRGRLRVVCCHWREGGKRISCQGLSWVLLNHNLHTFVYLYAKYNMDILDIDCILVSMK